MGFIDEYESFDALGLAALVKKGEVRAEELLEAAVVRLERHADLNAVVIPMLDEARATLKAGLPSGPFRGVPFLLKDLHLRYAGVRTTSGCQLFEDYVPGHDSEIVARYKHAGLVIFGKTASPEFGLTPSSESRLFGMTRNPWNTERSAGGSSGGSAAAVAAGIAPMANASDGGGSIRIPASCCGVFGLMPTRGRTPFGPDQGEGWSGMSRVHAVTRSVRDSAALLDVTQGPDQGAPYQAPPPERPYLAEVGRDPGSLRIALQREPFNGVEPHPDCVAAVEDAARLCEELGHTVEEARIDLDWQRLARATGTIISSNVRLTLNRRAVELGRELRQDDVEAMTWRMVSGVESTSAVDYAEAIQTIHESGRRLAAFLESRDLLLTPTLASPPVRLGLLSLDDPDPTPFMKTVVDVAAYSQLYNTAGNPGMSVPLSWNDEGLPVGVQFGARFGDEATLFRLAAQLEQARPWFDRRPVIEETR